MPSPSPPPAASPWPPGSIELGTEAEAFVLGRLEELKIPAEERGKLGAHALLLAFVRLCRADNRPDEKIAECLREIADFAEGGTVDPSR